MPDSAKFWNRMADGYAKRPVVNEADYQQKLTKTREYFSPDAEVLEIACGTGSTAIAHAPFVGHLRAVDISERMIEIARDKARDADVQNVSFEVGDVSALRLADDSFDAVLAMSILHLAADAEALLADVNRWVKPGGVFVSSTMCLAEGFGPLRFVLPLARLFGLVPDVRFFKRVELLDTIAAAGFEVEHQWQPTRKSAVFVVARKPER